MMCLTMLTNNELLQKLAVHNNSPDDLAPVKIEILRRIEKRNGTSTDEDKKLIEEATSKLTEMSEIESLGINLSPRERELSRQYFELTSQLLARMRNESDVLSKTI